MFNFFKKKEEPASYNLERFQEGFTKEQRAAILGSLLNMAQSDGETHPKELQIVEQARKLLGVDLDDPALATIIKSDKERILDILITLEPVQREWFIAALYSVILADGKVEDTETNFVKGFCEEIGVSEYDYIAITHKYR